MAVLAFRLALMYRFLVPSRFWFDPKVSGLLVIIIVLQWSGDGTCAAPMLTLAESPP